MTASIASGSSSNARRETQEMSSDQQQAARATITTPTEREIRIERVFAAPRDRVFAVYTDPALIPEWWGPRGTTTIVDVMDVRAGGSWRFVGRESDGTEARLPRHLPRGDAARADRADLRVGGHARPRLRRDRRVRGSRRPDEGHDDVDLPHHRGARRHARLGDGGRYERHLPAARRAARTALSRARGSRRTFAMTWMADVRLDGATARRSPSRPSVGYVSFQSRMTRTSRSKPRMHRLPVDRNSRPPNATGSSTQRAASARRMWPWAKRATLPSAERTSAMTRSHRAPTSSAVSPLGTPSR